MDPVDKKQEDAERDRKAILNVLKEMANPVGRPAQRVANRITSGIAGVLFGGITGTSEAKTPVPKVSSKDKEVDDIVKNYSLSTASSLLKFAGAVAPKGMTLDEASVRAFVKAGQASGLTLKQIKHLLEHDESRDIKQGRPDQGILFSLKGMDQETTELFNKLSGAFSQFGLSQHFPAIEVQQTKEARKERAIKEHEENQKPGVIVPWKPPAALESALDKLARFMGDKSLPEGTPTGRRKVSYDFTDSEGKTTRQHGVIGNQKELTAFQDWLKSNSKATNAKYDGPELSGPRDSSLGRFMDTFADMIGIPKAAFSEAETTTPLGTAVSSLEQAVRDNTAALNGEAPPDKTVEPPRNDTAGIPVPESDASGIPQVTPPSQPPEDPPDNPESWNKWFDDYERRIPKKPSGWSKWFGEDPPEVPRPESDIPQGPPAPPIDGPPSSDSGIPPAPPANNDFGNSPPVPPSGGSGIPPIPPSGGAPPVGGAPPFGGAPPSGGSPPRPPVGGAPPRPPGGGGGGSGFGTRFGSAISTLAQHLGVGAQTLARFGTALGVAIPPLLIVQAAFKFTHEAVMMVGKALKKFADEAWITTQRIAKYNGHLAGAMALLNVNREMRNFHHAGRVAEGGLVRGQDRVAIENRMEAELQPLKELATVIGNDVGYVIVAHVVTIIVVLKQILAINMDIAGYALELTERMTIDPLDLHEGPLDRAANALHRNANELRGNGPPQAAPWQAMHDMFGPNGALAIDLERRNRARQGLPPLR